MRQILSRQSRLSSNVPRERLPAGCDVTGRVGMRVLHVLSEFMLRKTSGATSIVVFCLCAWPCFSSAQGGSDRVPGTQFVAAANITDKNVKAAGTIFVPHKVPRVRAVLVTVGRAPLGDRAAEPFHLWRTLSETSECALLYLRLGTIRGEPAVGDVFVRDAAAGGAEALLAILQRLGEQSAHPELKDAPLLLWGGSAGAGFGTTLAELYPGRTVAFIRYHAHLRGWSPNLKVLKDIPALLIAGGKDATAGTEDAERLWKSGRSAGAPWTFAIEPGATHRDEQTLVASQELIIPWIAAVLRQRLPPGSIGLRPVTEESGWLGNNHKTEVAPYATFPGAKREASWLPDEVTAHGWRTVLGAAR